MRGWRGEGIWQQGSSQLLVVDDVLVANMNPAGDEMKLTDADAGVSLLACLSAPHRVPAVLTCDAA